MWMADCPTFNFRGCPWSNRRYSMWSVSQIQGQLTTPWCFPSEYSYDLWKEGCRQAKVSSTWNHYIWANDSANLYKTFWSHVPFFLNGMLAHSACQMPWEICFFKHWELGLSSFLRIYFLQEDVKLMVELGLDAYRFSISWSRLIPSMLPNINSS